MDPVIEPPPKTIGLVAHDNKKADLVEWCHYNREMLVAHRLVATGTFAPRAGEAEASTRQQAFVDRLLGQCARVGPVMREWADAAIAARGVRAIRLIQGVLSLTRRHPRERVLDAVREAHAQQHFRYQTIRRLAERRPALAAAALVTEDPAIRPMTQYTLEDFLR